MQGTRVGQTGFEKDKSRNCYSNLGSFKRNSVISQAYRNLQFNKYVRRFTTFYGIGNYFVRRAIVSNIPILFSTGYTVEYI